ncbi:MAG: hypothetical protein FWD34_10885 [Oscillospiraceae bacterium]|nr:hypothetical protein [Oscillospiraceae bacterium]
MENNEKIKKDKFFPIVGASVLGVFAIGAIIFLATRPDPVDPAPVETTTEATTTEATTTVTTTTAATTTATTAATTTEATTIDTTDYTDEPEEIETTAAATTEATTATSATVHDLPTLPPTSPPTYTAQTTPAPGQYSSGDTSYIDGTAYQWTPWAWVPIGTGGTTGIFTIPSGDETFGWN